jgi:hypothetical protein
MRIGYKQKTASWPVATNDVTFFRPAAKVISAE